MNSFSSGEIPGMNFDWGNKGSSSDVIPSTPAQDAQVADGQSKRGTKLSNDLARESTDAHGVMSNGHALDVAVRAADAEEKAKKLRR